MLEQEIRQPTLTEKSLTSFLARLDDQAVLQQFVENPRLALKQNGFDFSLGELTSVLSQNPELYDNFINQLAEKVDITNLSTAASTCCS